MDSKRQMSSPSSGWARRKKKELSKVEDKSFYISVIIDYYDYTHIS